MTRTIPNYVIYDLYIMQLPRPIYYVKSSYILQNVSYMLHNIKTRTISNYIIYALYITQILCPIYYI